MSKVFSIRNATGYKILLVEDDPNFGSILTDYLRMNNHDVSLATDGKEGLSMFRKGH